MSYQSNPAIDRYLTTFSNELAGMSEPERSEVVGEIRNHAAEAISAGEEPAAIIERFGDPTHLARAYKMELAVKSSRSFHPLRPIGRVARFFALMGLTAITSLMSFIVIVVLGAFTLAFTVGGVAGIVVGIVSLILPVELVQSTLPIPQALSELLAIGVGVLLTIAGFLSGVLLFFYVRMVMRSFRRVTERLRA